MNGQLFITHAEDSKTTSFGADSRHFGRRSMSYERRGNGTGEIINEKRLLHRPVELSDDLRDELSDDFGDELPRDVEINGRAATDCGRHRLHRGEMATNFEVARGQLRASVHGRRNECSGAFFQACGQRPESDRRSPDLADGPSATGTWGRHRVRSRTRN